MYRITLKVGNAERPFFDPRTDTYTIENPVMTREEARLASLRFTIYPDHPEFGNLVLKASKLKLYADDEYLMYFRPVNVKRTMQGALQYECEEFLGVVNDTMTRPQAFGTGQYVTDMLRQTLIASGAGGAATYVYSGNVSSSLNSVILEEKFAISEYTPIYDYWCSFFEKHATPKGYLVPRYVENDPYSATRLAYIDYLEEDALPMSDQTITFGKNLADLFIDSNFDEFFTVAVPLGVDKGTSPSDRSKGQQSKLPLVLEEQDHTETIDGIALRFVNDKIIDTEYYNIYGSVEKTVELKDAKNTTTLKQKAVDYIKENRGDVAQQVTLKAVDLRDTGVDVEHLKWMTRIPVTSEMHGISKTYVITKQTVQLDNPTKTEIELGSTKKGLTDIMSSVSDKNASKINGLDDRLYAIEPHS